MLRCRNADGSSNGHASDARRTGPGVSSGPSERRRPDAQITSMAAPEHSRRDTPRPSPASWFDDDVRAVQRAFDAAVESNRTLSRLVTDLKAAHARAVVFGGWVRDHLASRALRRPIVPADIDLVVEGISRVR